MRTWIDAADDFAAARGADRRAVDALRVYDRGGDRAWADDFAALEACLHPSDLADRIARELAADVDAHQAAMFAERFRSVARQLADDGDAESRILRVGLLERMGQILDEGGETRALRVRGVVDYVYSRAALHWHTRDGRPAPDLAGWARGAVFEPAGPGVELARLEGRTTWGPQRVSVLRVDPRRVTLDVRDAWSEWGPEQDLPALVAGAGAIAAFSGGFFLYSEPDLDELGRRHDPVGLVASGGAVHRPAAFARAALVQTPDGTLDVRVIGPGDHVLEVSGRRGRPTAFVNRARAKRARGVAIVGDRVVAAGDDVAVPLNGLVVAELDGRPLGASVGDRVVWRLPGVHAGLSGGPMLLRDGRAGFDLAAEDFAGTAPPRTFVDDETGDRNLLPRLAAGLTADGTLLVAAVDGRHSERALGLGLREVGELLGALGATRATNLDGGSSKRLIAGGAIADLPSVGVQGRGVAVVESRPLHTAVLLTPR